MTTVQSGPALSLRDALASSAEFGDLIEIDREVDPLIEIPGLLRAAGRLTPVPALLFNNIRDYPGRRVLGTLFADSRRLARVCGFDETEELTKFSYLEALDHPIAPELVHHGPCQENVIMGPVRVGDEIPPTHGALKVTRKYYQPVVVLKHPRTGRVNLSVYRCCIQPDGRVSINLRWDQHGGLFLKQAMELGVPLPVAICVGVPPAVYVAAVAKLPYTESETGFAGGILRRPLPMVKCKTIDLEVPATSEIVFEGEIRPSYERGEDGPWPEYLGYLGMEIHPPIVDLTCLTFRDDPIVNVFAPRTAPLFASMGTQAQLYRFLRGIFGEFVVDTTIVRQTVEHHAIVKVRKTEAHHEGLQMNVALAAFGFQNYLELITVVDEDVNIYDLGEVDWAICSRCNPRRQVHILPEARTHQNNPIAGVQEMFDEPITKAKMIIDATIPWRVRQLKVGGGVTFFTRSEWPHLDLGEYLRPADRDRWFRKP